MTLLHCTALDFDLTPLSGKFSLVPDCGRLLEFRLLTYILVWSQEANKVRATPRLIALGCQCFEQFPDPTSKVLYDWCSCLQQLTGSSVRTTGLEFGLHIHIFYFRRSIPVPSLWSPPGEVRRLLSRPVLVLGTPRNWGHSRSNCELQDIKKSYGWLGTRGDRNFFMVCPFNLTN